MNKILAVLGLCLSISLISCKSAYEKQGDKHLEAGRYMNALQRYKYVTEKGNGSKNFPNNLAKAYIGALEQASNEAPSYEVYDSYMEKIGELLQQGVKKETEEFYGKTALNIGTKLIGNDEFDLEDRGFKFLKIAKKYGGAAAASQVAKIESDFISKYLSMAEDEYNSAKGGNPEQGIVADYLLNKLSMFVEPTEEVNELWSKIREANLSTYLMYDLQGLIDRPIPAINKYGVLLGIRSIKRSGGSTAVQVQAYNGSTTRFKFLSENFALVDAEGNTYSPASRRGAFSKKDVDLGEETGVGEMTFKVPADADLVSLRFEQDNVISEKFLP